MQTLHWIALGIALAALVRAVLSRKGTERVPLAGVIRDQFPWRRFDPAMLAACATAGAATVLVPAVAGTALGALAWTSRVSGLRPAALILLTLLLKALLSGAEELIFRGALLSWISTRHGVGVAIAGSSLLFAMAHFGRMPVWDVAAAAIHLIDGVVLALLALRSRALWAPWAWHLGKNLAVWAAMGGGTLDMAPGWWRLGVVDPGFVWGAPGRAGALDVAAVAAVVGLTALALGRRRWPAP